MHKEPLPLDNPLIFYNNALYKIYNNMVHKLFFNLPDVKAESSDALVPVVRLPSPNEKHDSRSRTAHKNLLSRAVEALCCQVINITNKLYAKQGPDSSKAFLFTLFALCNLPTKDFARLYISIYRALTSFYLNIPLASDARSPLADSSKEEKTKKLAKGIQSQEEKLEKFMANAREALIQLVNNH
jgi:hypothetical protein